jgi:hypothetical protein
VRYRARFFQELLTFMLDGLHEDVNLVKKKEYVETEVGRYDFSLLPVLVWGEHLFFSLYIGLIP